MAIATGDSLNLLYSTCVAQEKRATVNRLPFPYQVRVISLLTEGNSLRATARLTDVHRTTIMRLAETVGEACDRLHHERMRDLQVACLQLDETWSFVNTKQKNLQDDSPAEHGDCYLWLALEADRKAIISYHIGKRTAEDARRFVADVRGRVLNRPQIVTDAYVPYEAAIAEAFGSEVDYLQLNKYRGEYTDMRGNPDLSRATTNHIERYNLTVRMHLRRCARRTSAHSKKIGPHRAAIALHIAFYNWCRVHETLRVTPAMELGLTDHIWSVAELMNEAQATSHDLLPLETPPAYPRPGRQPFKLYVVRGGKIR